MGQYNIEIFSCLLAFYSATFLQTNVESAQNRSGENLSISRIQSLHLLLEADDHDEEEYSVVSTLDKRYANKCIGRKCRCFITLVGRAQTVVQIVPPKHVSLFLHGKLCILHTNLRLLRK